LLDVVTAVLRRCGMNDADANILADTLVFADLSGIHSHGVLRVPEYAKKLTADGVDPQGRPLVVREMGACVVVDGNNSMGQIGCSFAMQQAIDRAAVHGIGAGGGGPWFQSLLRHGLLRTAGTGGGHDRLGHNECPANDGSMGRYGSHCRHQPSRCGHPGRG